MLRRIILPVILLLFSLPVPSLAAEPGNGTVEGRLVNGTKDGGKISGPDVTLVGYQNNSEVSSQTIAANAEGRFTFSGVSTDPSCIYQATTTYLDSDYYCEPFSFSSQETTKSIEVTVYETTASDANIRIAMAHTVIYPVAEGVQVERYYLIANDGDRAYTGSRPSTLAGKNETLRFSVPAGAADPQYLLGLMSCCIAPTSEGFVDTMSVTPDGREIAYSYTIPAGSGKFILAEKMAYPTTRFDILVSGDNIQLQCDQLAAKGKVDIRGISFQQFSGGTFDRGQAVSVHLSRLPRKSSQGFIIWAIAALAALASVFGFVYLLKKRRLQPVRLESSPVDKRQKLLVQLAQLDDDFNNGAISESVYQRLRAEKKAELVELMSKRDKRG